MEKSDKQEQRKNKFNDIKIFTIPFSLEKIKENITITTNVTSKPSKDQIINQALKFHSQGNASEAAKFYQYFINQGFKDPMAFSNYAGILYDIGNLQEAELLYRKAIKINPDYVDAHYNLGIILKELGKLQEAVLSYRKAIKINPDCADAHYNLGIVLKELGKLQEAELSTRKAIQINPNFAQAHYNLGNILRDLDKSKEAERSIQKAIEIKPDFAKANELLGLMHLQKGNPDLSLEYLAESARLLNEQKNKKSGYTRFKIISEAKIQHDIEQFEYLASQGYETKKFTDLAILYKNVASEIDWPSKTKLIPLNNKHQSILEGSYNCLIHRVAAPRLEKEAINDSLNIEKITNAYCDHEFGLTYIDNFLSPQALESLRKFLLESTIWFNVKNNGYLGTFLRDGFANPLIFQIADELRKKFPQIFKDYPINHIWAFKYDSRSKDYKSSIKGINVHADFAAVNVNFWITPKEANLNKKSGGLIVYDVEAPKEWDFQIYNNTNDKTKILEELKKSKGNTKVIPYSENRAVIFNSNLFHETDSYEFKEGYENRRINVTMLFGRRQ
ncbi:tetratricopeptide repeat protein [Prochlorococcus marinus]|uniref:tetratricopeptide repeat protein n=1 Tax=Prochlorococcus marinus TaxID=1219 RepID=UPI0022B3C36C|nr:tetratricopeptide repeat protein [Prochlorococcus marinus]